MHYIENGDCADVSEKIWEVRNEAQKCIINKVSTTLFVDTLFESYCRLLYAPQRYFRNRTNSPSSFHQSLPKPTDFLFYLVGLPEALGKH